VEKEEKKWSERRWWKKVSDGERERRRKWRMKSVTRRKRKNRRRWRKSIRWRKQMRKRTRMRIKSATHKKC